MSEKRSVVVNYQNGNARVELGDRALEIARSDAFSEEYFCPVELVSAAIGS